MDRYAPGVPDPVESMRVLITQMGLVRRAVSMPARPEAAK
jgi:hypothetical protein